MTTLERFAHVIAIAGFYLGSISIAWQSGAAQEADLAADAFAEAEYQQRLAQDYRAVIVSTLGGTEASLEVCTLARTDLRHELGELPEPVVVEVEVDDR